MNKVAKDISLPSTATPKEVIEAYQLDSGECGCVECAAATVADAVKSGIIPPHHNPVRFTVLIEPMALPFSKMEKAVKSMEEELNEAEISHSPDDRGPVIGKLAIQFYAPRDYVSRLMSAKFPDGKWRMMRS